MGCTNVGKSSLFNMFLQSDLCKPQVSDVVQRATISQWPGTTLNLLKVKLNAQTKKCLAFICVQNMCFRNYISFYSFQFPMTSPYGWRSGLRNQRLKTEKPMLVAEERKRQLKLQMTGEAEHAVLTGYVGQTFVSEQKLDAMESAVAIKDPFHVNPLSKAPPPSQRLGQWDPNNNLFNQSHWVYDTPGAVSTNQVCSV